MQPIAPPRPLDILFVISCLGVGGSERQLAILASALARSGMTVAVYSFMDGPVRTQLERGGVEVVLGPRRGVADSFGVVATAFDLFRFMFRRRPRIAHFFLPAAYLVGAPMAVLARVPVRLMSRRSLNAYQRHHRVVRVIEGYLHRLMQAILGNSRGVIEQLKSEGVAPAQLGLIYNGVEIGENTGLSRRNEYRTQLGLLPTTLVMSIVANLIPYKGHADLLNALSRVKGSMPADWRLLVVGRDDGNGDDLHERGRHFGLQDHLMFLGARDDVPAILAASDIGIICSHEEGFSNAILESMAASLPMIVTRVGGNVEAVIDGETGLVVSPKDPENLAAAIVRLAHDQVLRARFGEAGRRRVTDQFGIERFVRCHRAVYEALCAGRRPCDLPDIASS